LKASSRSPNRELAFKLIEAAISEPVQTRLMQAPYLIVPTRHELHRHALGLQDLDRVEVAGRDVDLALLKEGGERAGANIDPAFKAMEALKPNLSAVAANPGALATLFQQGSSSCW
jgi:hypothetical protein